ncbi:MAG TPA: hypothetical protein V6C95_19260 [Coleofasciculaceae cyanobacterium]
MVTTSTPAEQRTLLLNISWQTFKTMLACVLPPSSPRLSLLEECP